MAYQRKTYDEWEIQSNYGYGWDMETTENTYAEAKKALKEYRENLSCSLRIVKKRVPIENER